MNIDLKSNSKIAMAFLLSLFFLPHSLPASSLQSQNLFSFNNTEIKAYNHLLNLDFEKARQTLKANNQTESFLSPASIYIANLVDVTEVYITEDAELYSQYQSEEKSRMDLAGQLNDEPVKLFLQAEIKLHWAFAKLRFGHNLAAFLNLQQAHNLIIKNINRYPEFKLNFKTLGILHTLFDAIPDQYNWVTDLFGMKGNTLKGLEELNMAAKHYPVFKVETAIYTAVLRAFLLNEKDDALESLEKLESKNHTSASLIRALVYIKNAESNRAQSMLRHLINEQPNNYVVIHYYLAETYLHEGSYSKAIKHYKAFLGSYAGETLVKDAYHKTAICHYLRGNNDFNKYLALASENGNTQSEADKYAHQMLKNGEGLPNKVLLKARYATDGGYYQLADAILNQHSYKHFSLPKDKTEYYYRKARLYHKRKLLLEAEGYYLKTIFTQHDASWYYAPNACLQLGYIYLEAADKEKASIYFNKAMTYGQHPYKSSIEKKATIGLSWCNP